MIQPMRKVTNMSVTLSCGHKVRLDALLKKPGLVPTELACLDCPAVPEKAARRFVSGGRLPWLRAVEEKS